MTVTLGAGWPQRVIAPDPEPPDAVLERDPVTAALLNIRELLEELIAREVAPIRVEAPPVDLSSLTTALSAFGPPDAQAIGQAIASAIQLPTPPPQDTTALAALLAALEKLDFRMKGTGGGGSLSPDITDRTNRQLGHVVVDSMPAVSAPSVGTTGTAIPTSSTLVGGSDGTNLRALLSDALGNLSVRNYYADSTSKLALCTTLSSSGDHTLITPATGNRIRILYVTFTPSSDNTAANLVKVGYGTTGGAISNELYRAYAAGHGAVFEGTANQSVIVNTQTAEAVAFTFHYQEIT